MAQGQAAQCPTRDVLLPRTSQLLLSKGENPTGAQGWEQSRVGPPRGAGSTEAKEALVVDGVCTARRGSPPCVQGGRGASTESQC